MVSSITGTISGVVLGSNYIDTRSAVLDLSVLTL